MAELKRAFVWTTTVGSLALLWYVFVAANEAMFKGLELNPGAALIYLPAALRVIYVLVFRNAGVFAIMLGSYLAFPTESADGMLDAIVRAILSGLAPLIGILMFKKLFRTRPDLADLLPTHLLAVALLCAASNTLILNLYLAVSGNLLQPLRQIATILIGDITGTAIVLYLTSFVLTFVISRRRV